MAGSDLQEGAGEGQEDQAAKAPTAHPGEVSTGSNFNPELSQLNQDFYPRPKLLRSTRGRYRPWVQRTRASLAAAATAADAPTTTTTRWGSGGSESIRSSWRRQRCWAVVLWRTSLAAWDVPIVSPALAGCFSATLLAADRVKTIVRLSP